MSNKLVKKTSAPEAGPAPVDTTPPTVVLFELEYLAANGRQIIFNVLKKCLAEYDLTLTPALFARYSFFSLPQFYLEDLLVTLGAKKVPVEKLIAEIQEGIGKALMTGDNKVNPMVNKLIRQALETPSVVGAVSFLPKEDAESLLTHLGLDPEVVKLFTFEAEMEKSFPRPDTWLKIIKLLNKKARRCLVVASSMTSCKSALAADMLCVALPDDFTSFHDFSGANLVVDDPSQADVKDILEPLMSAV